MSKYEGFAFIVLWICIATAICFIYKHRTRYDCTKVTTEVLLYGDKCTEKHKNYTLSQCLDTAKEIYCEVK